MPAMKGFSSITPRLIFWILLAGGAVFAATMFTSNSLARETALRAAEQEAVWAAAASAGRIQAVLRSVEEATELLGATVEALDPAPEALAALERRLILSNTAVYGSAAAFEPRAYRPDRERYGAYTFRGAGTGDQLAQADLALDRYRYWERAWYTAPLEARRPAWSEPYVDEGGGGVSMVTYAVPVVRPGASGPFGVVTADVPLDWLSKLAADVHVGRTGFAFVLSREGRVLAHPGVAANSTPLLDQVPPERRALLEPLVAKVLSGQAGFERVELRSGPHWITYAPVTASGWTLAVVYPDSELGAAVRRLRVWQASLALGGLALLALVVVTLSHRLTAPLRELAASARGLAGNLELPLPEPRSRDELGALTGALRDMRAALVRHIEDLRQATAAQARIEGELKAARRIQKDMLPAEQAGGAGTGYTLAARLHPARAVGGDLYDHFVQDGRVVFLLADVSGKGVGPALFMARTKTLFEAITARESDPAAVLRELNRGLCRDNDAGMFVTGVCGWLDSQSGELAFASAGHDAPVHVRAEGPPEPFTAAGGPVLGLLEAADYPLNRLRLLPGESLVAFTDGISEAMNHDREEWGEQRLGELLRDATPREPVELIAAILGGADAYAAGAVQHDDMTLVVLRT
jgi:sigma-B regulation protein RsbU (phosphoserine phosphatase)